MTIGMLLFLILIVALFVYVWFFAPVGWRTRLFNWISILGGAVLWVLQAALPALQTATFDFLPQVWAGLATLLILVGNAMLREVTTTPPGSASPAAVANAQASAK